MITFTWDPMSHGYRCDACGQFLSEWRSAACMVVDTGRHNCQPQPIESPPMLIDSKTPAVDLVERRAAQDPEKVADAINPKHYKGDLVMRIIEHFGLDDSFSIGNCVKYLLRHREKGGVEDLRKAAWYLQRAIDKAEGKLAAIGAAVR